MALLPVAALVFVAAGGLATLTSGAGWQADWLHLATYVLPRTLADTGLLLVLVAIGTTVMGTGCAWLVSTSRFATKSVWDFALVLPLAVPPYIAAYTHLEFLDYSGPVQTALRGVTGFSSGAEYWFPDVRSVWGAGFVLSLVLYPYVYMTCRLFFSMQGASTLDAGRSLGANSWRLFWKVGLPMARPAIAAGVAVALMETLNDIGAVEVLGVRTITYIVFDTWLNRDSLTIAVQLALVALVFVAACVWLERRFRAKRGGAKMRGDKPPALTQLSAGRQWAAATACALPVVGGIGVPLYVLTRFSVRRPEALSETSLHAAAINSVLLSLLTAIFVTAIAYVLLQIIRSVRSQRLGTIARIASLGYAVPGTILAVGLLVPLSALDNYVDALMRSWFGFSTGLLLTGSIVVLVYACSLRFLAIGFGAIETGFEQLSTHIDMAARSLGRSRLQTALSVHLPNLRPALAVAFLLVFVDTMKELSATLLLRPFNFETLATLVYGRASQGQLEDASLAALIIVLIGTIPVIVLTRMSQAKHAGDIKSAVPPKAGQKKRGPEGPALGSVG
ncbi:MAG: iron ABC transporter permease [Pseudomonadota bacterium]